MSGDEKQYEENVEMFRHYDQLFWTTTTIFLAAVAVIASSNSQRISINILALFVTSCFFYLSLSFRKLAKNNYDRKEKKFPLQTGVYITMIGGIMLFFIYRLYSALDLFNLILLSFIAIVLPFIVGLIDCEFRGDFKK
jgi:hypothetical protein